MSTYDRAPGFGPQRVLRIVGLVLGGVILAALFALAFGWFVQLLWNWLMPGIFGLGTIGYWQAFGLVILGKLIFGGINTGHDGRPRRSRAPWEKQGHWKPPEWDRGWGRERWTLWKDFWNEEGREAFERYSERRSAAGGGTAGGSTTGSGTTESGAGAGTQQPS
jgi:hypothetical protein